MDVRFAGRYACAILIFAGCAESRPSSAANPTGNAGSRAGNGSSLSAAGRGGSGGSRGPSGNGEGGAQVAGAGSGASMCEARSQEAGKRLSTALEGAELGCSVAADCEHISIDTDCGYRCGWLVSQRGKRVVQDVITELNAGICDDFEAASCSKGFVPPCVPPSPFECRAGACRDAHDVAADAGSDAPDTGPPPDASTPDQGCIHRTISWGPNGGLVAYQDRFTLAPCKTFSAERLVRADPSSPSCENEIATTAAVTADEVDVALDDADVQAALAEAPVLYGLDSRPVDGTVFQIAVGDAVIELGSPCNGGACRTIPPGLAALRELLESLTEQQLALDGCEALRR